MIRNGWFALFLFLAAFVQAQGFSTQGNSIRAVVAADMKGSGVLYVSELDGAVSCYTVDGKKLWRNPTRTSAVMFEIQAFDVDGDGSDELLAASGDGNIYCWNADGMLRWKFNPGHKVRFSEVAALKEGKMVRIFAGGNDYTLYELDAAGNPVSETRIEGVVRKIEAGDFLARDEPLVFLMTYSHDKFRWEFMGLLDPKSKKVQKELFYKDVPGKTWGKFMVNDLSVADIDQDGRDDLLFFGHNDPAVFVGMNGDFEEIARFAGSGKHKQRYAHGIGTCLLPVRKEIVLQYGGMLYVCDLKGKLLHTSGEKLRGIIFNDLVLDPKSGQLLAGGQVGGGNTIYSYALNESDWWKTGHTLSGRMADVERNLGTLYKQALQFKLPAYQKRPDKPWMMITGIGQTPEVQKLNGADMVFIEQIGMEQSSDRKELVAAIGEAALKKDRRRRYHMTQEEIVELARQRERDGLPFTSWVGHGNDPFIVPIDTLEKVLDAAPNTCYGFIYAEMHDPEDLRVRHFIKEYIPRLAKAIRKNGGRAKLYFRYKNVFWAASSHQEPWKGMFFSGKYSDILVPSAEDTNSRTQDINFAGRVGMLVGGYVDDFATRLVDDNPTSWRPLSPGGQRSVSPYLRNGALLAAYGARYGILFDIGYLEDPGMNILFALMKSGVLPVVERDDILSIGSWHLIQNANEELIHTIDDGHNMLTYSPQNPDAVFSVAQIGWCGANLPGYDYSKAALGVEYRWLNFMPPMPNGMVPVAPIEYAPKLVERNMPYTVSDCKVGYINGKPVPAKEFGPSIEKAAKTGAQKLPMVVSGASWSAIRLDANHTRVVLIDQGYIDPQDRAATIHFQGEVPKDAVDILSGEKLPMSGNTIQLTVPAGSMRFVDIAY